MATVTPLPVDIKIVSTTFLSSFSSSVALLGGSGGAISISGALDLVDVSITSSTIS